jgi:glyoxylase-like metal-dependent hydrolase (beta-lactamase superfamily II)
VRRVIERLDDGLCAWRARHPEWHPGKWGAEVVSFAVGEPGRTLLVDPLVPDDLWEELDGVVDGSVEILITVPYHVRSASAAAARYGARVWGHPACAKRLADPAAFCELRPDRTPEGVSAYVIGKPRRHEMPVRIASQRALVFGDAVVGTPEGLRVWEQTPSTEGRERWYSERYLPTLEPLALLDIERVLVTHGPSVIRGGRRALRDALAAPPWHHRG